MKFLFQIWILRCSGFEFVFYLSPPKRPARAGWQRRTVRNVSTPKTNSKSQSWIWKASCTYNLQSISKRASQDTRWCQITTHTTARCPTSRRGSTSLNEILEASNPECSSFSNKTPPLPLRPEIPTLFLFECNITKPLLSKFLNGTMRIPLLLQ